MKSIWEKNKKSTGICKNVKGFTMLEVAMAILILTIGLLGVSGLIVSVINTNKTSVEMSKATTLAQSQMEDIRRQGYLVVGESGTSVTEDYGTISGFPSFQRVTSVSAASETPGVKIVTVTVLWKYRGNHFVELKSILAR